MCHRINQLMKQYYLLQYISFLWQKQKQIDLYGEPDEEEGVEGGEDGPKFNYANAAALTLFEGNWDDLIGLPSSQSAEDAAEVQADRDRLLA